jgi:hypothetical protein
MAHEWHAGVLSSSSWHGLEQIGVLLGADGMISAGEDSGAWPISLDSCDVQTTNGLACPDTHAIVAHYRKASDRVVGVVGDRYRSTTPDGWRSLVRAACLAGAKPTGAMALRKGSVVIATFDLNGGADSGIRTHLVLADAFDGSMRLTAGFTSVRVVCANTLSVSLSTDGKGMAALRHTASLDDRVRILSGAIGASIESGTKVRETFKAAEAAHLDGSAARAAFDALFPEAPKDATPAAKTRADNVRTEARRAATLPVNRVGSRPGNLATLWNAATYLVDRKADGSAREVRGGDSLDSMLFGTRANRVQEIQTQIEVILRDGKVQVMTASDAIGAGVDPKQVGASVLADILG